MFLEHLYSAYHAAMKSRAMRYIGTQIDAEDVVSDCWVSFIQHLPELCKMADSTRSTYIMTSVRNRAIDYLRKKSRSRECVMPDEDTSEVEKISAKCNVETTSLQKEALREMMEVLSPREQQVTYLWLRGYKSGEIAMALDITPSAVRGHEFKIRKKWNAQGIWSRF